MRSDMKEGSVLSGARQRACNGFLFTRDQVARSRARKKAKGKVNVQVFAHKP